LGNSIGQIFIGFSFNICRQKSLQIFVDKKVYTYNFFSCSKEPARDCIILFTDGQANDGITEPKKLVREFKLRVERSGRTTGIPVSAFTIGDNQPYFISQVSSDATHYQPYQWSRILLLMSCP